MSQPQLVGIVCFGFALRYDLTILLNPILGRDASHMCLISLSPRHMCTTTTHVPYKLESKTHKGV